MRSADTRTSRLALDSALTRRSVLRAGLAVATAGTLTACGDPDPGTGRGAFVAVDGDEVRAAESRRNPGAVRDFRLTATVGQVDLGGRTVTTWSYGGELPGAPLRVKVGEVVRATLTNRLPAPTTIHWHGLALRNDADGVPDVTQPTVPAGGERVYEFTAAHPGTYWFHPHHGTQLDRGLYSPLIVDDPDDPVAYDDEWIVVLDDWLDGVSGSPDDALAELRKGMAAGHDMSAMGTNADSGYALMGATSALLGGDAGDVRYPYFLLNGRLATAPVTHRSKAGNRLRIRIINAGGDTAFRVAVGGHRMTITHTDGFPTRPVETDALLVGMGERYDVLVTLRDGVFPVVAVAEGKNAAALGVIRTGSGAVPTATVRPRELDGKVVSHRVLEPADAVRLPARKPDRTITFKLSGTMEAYDWAINGRPYDPAVIDAVRAGERVKVDYVNATSMWHPMHLHGHTFAAGETGVRKDTVIVLPNQTVSTVFDADNPGIWMVHCHNLYHAEAGMMTLFGYER